MSRLTRSSLLGIAVALVASAAPAHAHDFWVSPSAHVRPAPGPVDVHLFVGQPGEVDELERLPFHISKFEAHGKAGATRIPGKDRATPAGRAELAAPDTYTLVYHSRHSIVELPPRRFDNYLAEEGLLDIIAEREKLGESERPGVDSFARYAKALVRVGGATEGFDREVGLPAELVAVVDPIVGGHGGFLEFRLTFHGRPKAGARVDLLALRGRDLVELTHQLTDADGRVRFVTPGKGRWLVSSTLMQRAAYPVEGDWESFWASLAFETVSLEGMPAAPGGESRSRTALIGAAISALVLLAGWQVARRRRAR